MPHVDRGTSALRHPASRKVLYGLFLIVFTLLFFLVRRPVYSTNLVGEDGIFADIFVNQPAGPDYLQLGRVNGKEIYAGSWHPALNYEILRGAGFLAGQLIDFSTLTDFQTTWVLRSCFSLFQLLIWLLFIIAILVSGKNVAESNRWIVLAAIILASMAPIAVHNSIELQIDTTVGVLTIGLFCFSLMLNSFNILRGIPFAILLFLASVGVGFGKNEWSLVIGIAVSLVALLRFALNNYLVRTGLVLQRGNPWILVTAFTGCLLGNGISYLVDPQNYLMGWWLMGRMTGTASIVGSSGIRAWAELTLKRLPSISVILLFLIYALIRIIRNRRTIALTQILSFTVSGCLFGVFFFSAWHGGTVRYFAPAYVASAATAIVLFPRKQVCVHTSWYALLCICWLGYSYSWYPDLPSYRPVKIIPQGDCIQILGVAQGYDRKDIDYIGNSLGSGQRDEMVKKSGKPLCKP